MDKDKQSRVEWNGIVLHQREDVQDFDAFDYEYGDGIWSTWEARPRSWCASWKSTGLGLRLSVIASKNGLHTPLEALDLCKARMIHALDDHRLRIVEMKVALQNMLTDESRLIDAMAQVGIVVEPIPRGNDGERRSSD